MCGVVFVCLFIEIGFKEFTDDAATRAFRYGPSVER